MKKVLRYLLIFVSTFTVATALTMLYFRLNVQFESKGVGSMSMCNEGLGRFSSYESYDGEKLVFSSIRFPSVEAARECFETTLGKNNFTILSREVLFDGSGTVITGERIVGKDDRGGPDFGFVFSLDEDWIVGIDSTSLRHALIFEKQARKY
jgi:hypothetical protein